MNAGGFKHSLCTKFFIIVDKLKLLNELQNKQVKYLELQNLDELASRLNSVVFTYGINTFLVLVSLMIDF
jgi:hypothetical protein